MEVDHSRIDPEITKEEWIERCVHLCIKLNAVIGINDQEQKWMREAGFPTEGIQLDDIDLVKIFEIIKTVRVCSDSWSSALSFKNAVAKSINISVEEMQEILNSFVDVGLMEVSTRFNTRTKYYRVFKHLR